MNDFCFTLSSALNSSCLLQYLDRRIYLWVGHSDGVMGGHRMYSTPNYVWKRGLRLTLTRFFTMCPVSFIRGLSRMRR